LSKCSDIHECDRHAHNCDINAGCSNTEGSFACACNAGYDGDGENCVDVDECDAGLHNCDTNDAVFYMSPNCCRIFWQPGKNLFIFLENYWFI